MESWKFRDEGVDAEPGVLLGSFLHVNVQFLKPITSGSTADGIESIASPVLLESEKRSRSSV